MGDPQWKEEGLKSHAFTFSPHLKWLRQKQELLDWMLRIAYEWLSGVDAVGTGMQQIDKMQT